MWLELFAFFLDSQPEIFGTAMYCVTTGTSIWWLALCILQVIKDWRWEQGHSVVKFWLNIASKVFIGGQNKNIKSRISNCSLSLYLTVQLIYIHRGVLHWLADLNGVLSLTSHVKTMATKIPWIKGSLYTDSIASFTIELEGKSVMWCGY